ncbi:MAG: phosphatase PAP2 family protein [Rhodanobacter sp.]|jgi:undecaprenyl-diphosphatase|nr:phosphatase PAP2 family protein [Rhodanobacter sp.]
MRISAVMMACVSLIVLSSSAQAAGGPFGIDHRIAYDNSGLWKRQYQINLEYATALTVIGGALWEGGDSRLGHTFWQSLDAMVFSVGAAQVMKWTFSRKRPSATANPNEFFKGGGNQSFPSGEVSEIAGAVTPFVLEYGREYPAVYGLEGLVLYDMVARMKVHAHWQSDVIVGAGIGTALGLYAHQRDNPLILGWLPHGAYVGLKKTF